MARWCSDGDGSGSVSRRRFLGTSLAVGGSGLVGSAIAAEAGERGAGAGSRSDALDVRDFGALGDGRTRSTRAIQRAIDAAHRAGGGTVRLPAGDWLSGSLRLRS